MALSLGLENPQNAARAILAGHRRNFDVGKVVFPDGDGKETVAYMCNLIGWGLGVDANVTAEEVFMYHRLSLVPLFFFFYSLFIAIFIIVFHHS